MTRPLRSSPASGRVAVVAATLALALSACGGAAGGDAAGPAARTTAGQPAGAPAPSSPPAGGVVDAPPTPAATPPTPTASESPSSPRPTIDDAVRDYRADTSYESVADPVRIEIPSLGVTSALEELGRNADGTVEVPGDWDTAGWYTGGAKPGQVGSSVILGHVDSKAGPAVFAEVHDLPAGAEIRIERADGTVATFVVERVEQHPKDDFPTADVYYPTLEPLLRLVTCGGSFDRDWGHYRDNVIVFARLVA